MTTRRDFLKTVAAVPLAGSLDLGIAGATAVGMMGLALPVSIGKMQFRDEPVSYWLEQWQHPAHETFFDLLDAAHVLAGVSTETMPALVGGLVDPKRKRQARAALWDAGDAAVPVLLEALARDSRQTREAAARLLREIQIVAELPQEPLFAALGDPSPTVRVGVAEALLSAGAPAKRVIPVLLGVLDQGDEHDRSNAIHAAAKAKSNETLVVFEAGLAHDDPSVQALAAQFLLEQFPGREDLIATLVNIIENDPHCIRGNFARSTAGMALAEDDPAGRARLMKLLDHDDPAIICEALGHSAARPAEIMPALERCLNHPEAEVRCRAAAAFKYGPSDKRAAAQLLIKTLRDSDPSVRKAAVESLQNLDPRPSLVSRPLCRLLHDAVENVRVTAAVALAQFGSADQKAVAVLLAALPSFARPHSLGEFSRMTEALGECRADLETVAPTLLEILDSGVNADVRLAALEALHDLGLPDARAIRLAAEMMEDDANSSAGRAADLLAEMGEEGLSRLVAALGHRSKQVRKRALRAIGRIGRNNDSVLHIVAKGLRDESALVREAAACAIGEIAFRWTAPRLRIGERLRACVPLLADSLRDGDIAVRWAAARALGCFKAAAESAIGALETARADPVRVVRSCSEAALAEIRKPSPCVAFDVGS